MDLSEETSLLDCNPIESSIENNHKLQSETGESVDIGRYHRLIRKLIYLSHTRLDITYVVSVVSQFIHGPRELHMQAIFRILRYLKFDPGKGLLLFKHSHLQIEGFMDAD